MKIFWIVLLCPLWLFPYKALPIQGGEIGNASPMYVDRVAGFSLTHPRSWDPVGMEGLVNFFEPINSGPDFRLSVTRITLPGDIDSKNLGQFLQQRYPDFNWAEGSFNGHAAHIGTNESVRAHVFAAAGGQAFMVSHPLNLNGPQRTAVKRAMSSLEIQ